MTTDETPVQSAATQPVSDDAETIAAEVTAQLEQQNARLLMLHGKYAPLPSETQP